MKNRAKTPSGFSLLEVLVATSVLVIILLVMVGMTDNTSKIWRKTTGKIEQFREAREGFESLTRRLSQATLNTFWDYDNISDPKHYVRQSELRFISGPMQDLVGGTRQFAGHGIFFVAPLGQAPGVSNVATLHNLLNVWGFFVEFGSDASLRPAVITPSVSPLRYRYRLFEFMEPSNELEIYKFTSGSAGGVPKNLTYVGKDWFETKMTAADNVRPARLLASNIIALVILPKLSVTESSDESRLAPNYLYDSTATNSDPQINPRHQLPPVVQVTMIAIDEPSAVRLENGSTPPDFGLQSLFQIASEYEADLQRLESNLIAMNVSYRVFTTNVRISGAKWSTAQKD